MGTSVDEGHGRVFAKVYLHLMVCQELSEQYGDSCIVGRAPALLLPAIGSVMTLGSLIVSKKLIISRLVNFFFLNNIYKCCLTGKVILQDTNIQFSLLKA